MLVKGLLLFFVLNVFAAMVHAQTTANGGWLFITHTQKISSKFDVLADVQLRTADRYKYLNTFFTRNALSYNFNKKHSAALGYMYKADWMHEENSPAFMNEHRVFEQYLYNFKLKHTELMVRTRLEQRFVNEDKTSFSQRARLFLSAQIPINTDTAFTKGVYIGLQNEIFLNVQNKHLVNGRVFDQNRPFTSLGYRWNKHLDTEAGYQYWFQKQTDGDYRNHIFQVTLTTNF